MCRKMRSETAKRVVQPRLHRPDRTIHDFRDLGQVQAVQVVQHDHQAVLGSELVDRAEHKPSELRLLREMRWRAIFVRERLVDGVVQRGKDDAFAWAPVIGKIHRDAIQPGPQRGIRLESGERAVRARERVDDDLFSGGRVFRDGESEAEYPVAVAVEEGVEGDRVPVARRVHEIVVGAAIPARGVAVGLHAARSSGRKRRIPRRLRSPPSRPWSTTPPAIGAWMNSVALVARATWVTLSAPKNKRSPARASSTLRPSMACWSASRGRATPFKRYTCCTSPEQSRPSAVVPPHKYGTPMNISAVFR